MDNILPADTFVVINKTILRENRRILISLYQPLIGSTAISLYYTLWTYLDHFECLSDEITHHIILNNMMISINEFIDARKKLEAVGLIKSYLKKGDVKNYIYELYSPINAEEFLNNPVFSMALMNAVGEIEYQKIIEFFKLPVINLKNYEDITSKFTDTFIFDRSSLRELEICNLRNRNTRQIELISKIDINTVLSLIPNEMLNHNSILKSDRDFLIKISYIYNYSENEMVELIRNSLTERHTIDKKLLKENALKNYQFDNMGKLPSLIYKNQPEYLRSEKKELNSRNKIINMFETTSPYDFIASKYKTGTPSSSDLKIVAYLLLDLELKPGVVNVLIDYVLKINQNKLNKAFVDVIASQWKKSNIETVENAMNLAEEEYHARKNNKYKSTKETNNTKIKPSWLEKNIEENKATEAEIEEFERMLQGEV